tara:strand:- start:3459 stop:4271 length:813 start_codon:yes stop_codon:yes gene_type:complete
MIILSIDVGMKNLAYCLFESINNDYKILKWDIINLCNEKKNICKGVNKNNKCCTKTAKYFKCNNYYCKIHAKKKKYKIPSFKTYKINKLSLKKLRLFGDEHDLSFNKLSKKQQCYNEIMLDISNNYFNTVSTILTKDLNLIDYGINIKELFKKNFDYNNIDLILIENQIGPLALRMKSLQGMIIQHFVENDIHNIICVNSNNKLKDFLGNKKTTYNERKKESVKITSNIINNSNLLAPWIDIFNNHKKKDDLADCFLQVLWYFNKKLKNN